MLNKLRTVAAIILLATVSLMAALWVYVPHYQIEGLTLTFSAFPAPAGSTRLEIPPLGEIAAKTHSLPLVFKVTIKQVSMSYLAKVAAPDFSIDQFLFALQQQGEKAVVKYIITLAALAVVINFLLSWVVKRSFKWVSLISAGLIIVVIIGGAFGIRSQYSLSAFRQPRYTGLLTAAPWLVGTVEEKINDFEAFRSEVRHLAANLYKFYAKTEDWSSVNLDNNTIKVMHVSDIHNNIAAFDLINRVAKDFQVDFIIDTGDITDLGTPLEAELVSRVQALGLPYYYLGGNHDSTEVLTRLEQLPNLTVIKQPQLLQKDKLKILAFPDPVAVTSTAETLREPELGLWQKAFYATYQQTKKKPEIVATHTLTLAEKLIGRVPVILVGHDHQASIKMVKRSIVIDAGTTGAAGVRGLNSANPPMSLKILYFNQNNQQLLAVDSLTLQPVTNEFFLQRSLIKRKAEKSLPIKQSSSSFSMTWLKRVN